MNALLGKEQIHRLDYLFGNADDLNIPAQLFLPSYGSGDLAALAERFQLPQDLTGIMFCIR